MAFFLSYIIKLPWVKKVIRTVDTLLFGLGQALGKVVCTRIQGFHSGIFLEIYVIVLHFVCAI